MKRSCTIIFFGFLSLGLVCSCAPFNPVDVKRTACRQLKSDIAFNAATGDVRQANMERTERPLQEDTYDRNHCELY